MPVISPPAILGPEMAAPILWVPWIFELFLLENLHAHKIPRFRWGYWVFFFGGGGGGSANVTFVDAGIFLNWAIQNGKTNTCINEEDV